MPRPGKRTGTGLLGGDFGGHQRAPALLRALALQEHRPEPDTLIGIGNARSGYGATCERVAIGYPVMPDEQYVAGLNRKIIGAGVLFRDAVGRVLLVEPSYKPDWGIPGGAVEADESPWAAAARELSEELGLDRTLGQLLVVDYVRPQDLLPECVVFVFDGGMLDETEAAGMVFPDGEIISASFHTLTEARSRVTPLLADRLDVAVQAVEQRVTALCEEGRRIT